MPRIYAIIGTKEQRMRFAVARLWEHRRLRRVLAWGAGTLAVVAIGLLGYGKLIEGAWVKYNQWDRRERGSLKVGQPAPDLELPLLDEGTVRLSELWRERPVVLVFGSCT
jgi:hypothetical protein